MQGFRPAVRVAAVAVTATSLVILTGSPAFAHGYGPKTPCTIGGSTTLACQVEGNNSSAYGLGPVNPAAYSNPAAPMTALLSGLSVPPLPCSTTVPIPSSQLSSYGIVPSSVPGTWSYNPCYLLPAGNFSFAPTGTSTPGSAGPIASPASVAQLALSSTHVPSPGTLGFSPDDLDGVGPLTIVNYPTWLSISPSLWHPVSTTASVGGISATATATPSSVVWDMGNGHATTCDDPGTAWNASMAPADGLDPPDPSGCEYVYPDASPGGAVSLHPFTVTATIHWTATWTGTGGTGGNLGTLTSSGSAPLSVTEVKTLITSEH